jgi:hypothetical protein
MAPLMKEFNLTRSNFSELERLIEELSGDFFINDSYFSGLNVVMEQFYQWTFFECGAINGSIAFDLSLDKITISWIFNKEVFGKIKSSFSGESCKACDIVMQIVDHFEFDDHFNTTIFQFSLTNNFEKIYVSRASILSDYYHKNRVTDSVHHDTF